jgi:hypothetical protein
MHFSIHDRKSAIRKNLQTGTLTAGEQDGTEKFHDKMIFEYVILMYNRAY